jgi:ArsR family transcriptional regulator
MLECARQRIAQRDARNVTLKHGELEHLPIRDQTCDLAIACLVLHHVAAPNEALAEMHRIVRPAGRILIVEQQSHENRDFYETMQDRWWGFEPAELARQVAAAGFQAVRHHPLATARGKPNSTDAPALFVITAQRAGPS